MSSITALLHTENDALRLGRCLETLYPCDEILIVDHGSRDATLQVAREYGARVVTAERHKSPDHYPHSVRFGWILCLEPRESLTEALAASLFEWKSDANRVNGRQAEAFSVSLREETARGWVEIPGTQTRLVPVGWKRWQGRLPITDQSAATLEGAVLRFLFP